MEQRICAILRFDENTERKIQQCRDLMSEKYQLPQRKLYPHITLAHYEVIDPAEIISYTEQFMAYLKPFEVRFISTQVLSTDCIACIADDGGVLRCVYEAYHQVHDNRCDFWTKMENQVWIPHSTLYCSIEKPLDEINAYLNDVFEPFVGTVTSIELSVVKETGFEIIFSKMIEPEEGCLKSFCGKEE